MDSQTVRISLHNILKSADGAILLDWLESLAKRNYEAFKRDPENLDELHKGYAMAIDKVIDTITKCDKSENEVRIYNWS